MQAYHQQLANLNLPIANNTTTSNTAAAATSNLLIASQQMNNNMQQNISPISINPYQSLVNKSYQQATNGTHCNGLNMMLPDHYEQSTSDVTHSGTPSMASFAVKLMSLDVHELRCLNADNEIMRHINKAQSLMDSRLQDIHAKTALMNRMDENGRNTLCQQPLNLNALVQHNQRQQQEFQMQQQQQHLLLSPNGYFNNYYAKQQLAFSQYAQMQHEQQQQQLFFMASRLNNMNCPNDNSTTSNISQAATNTGTNSINTATPLTSNKVNYLNSQAQQPIVVPAPALDLRTTPTRPMSALSATPSPVGQRASSAGSSNASRQSSAPLPPKKMQSSEYKKMQQLAEHGDKQLYDQAAQLASANSTAAMRQYNNDGSSAMRVQELTNQNTKPGKSSASSNKRSHQQSDDALNHSADRFSHRNQPNTKGGGTFNAVTGKKYKGEFDEPSPDEVIEREKSLHVAGHYHERALESGKCACVLGSDFRDKTKREALELLDRWRKMDIEERTKWKWDLSDLPEDISLSEIKKYEDLRSEYSQGRADFGGASKRKPLSIRGTRQFLLMLYCLWGHPGREDPMQRDGYCPHCFAKIRTDNEQSTLVRVVNHFNMKHRRGANPRLSPHLVSRNSPAQVASPQSHHQVTDTLLSVVKAVEEEDKPTAPTTDEHGDDNDNKCQFADSSDSDVTDDASESEILNSARVEKENGDSETVIASPDIAEAGGQSTATGTSKQELIASVDSSQ